MVPLGPAPDVLIAGAGPAGLALGAELGRRGVAVAVVDSDLVSTWPRSYGCWAAALPANVVDSAIVGRFPHPLVTFSSGRSKRLGQEYVRFDTRRLQTTLKERAQRAGVRFIQARFEHAEDEASAQTANLVDEAGRRRQVQARVIVDCRGRPTAGGTARQAAPAFQSAFGAWFEVSATPFGPGEMSLMDFRSAPAASDDGAASPSFLYAAPEGAGILFAQETVLASRRAVPMSVLRSRLLTRLAALGVSVVRTLDSERCLIPLGAALPSASSRFLAFGAAAGMVQPSSGYSLARSLFVAADVAEALVSALAASTGAAQPVVRAGQRAVWPNDTQRAWALHRLGLETLLDWKEADAEAFWHAFFELPSETVWRFMDGSLPARDVASAMWRVFLHLPLRLRLALFRGGARFFTQPTVIEGVS